MPNSVHLIGESPAFLEMMEQIARFAKTNRPLFLIGERGTGKELVAQRAHRLSGRGLEKMVTINCSAFSTELLNSELFGHEKGSFTGATERRDGKIALAHGGTLFLDEIGTSSLSFQEQMLRVVEYGQIQRVGGDFPTQVDVRMIAATNENPLHLAQSHRFRKDLLDRLSFGVIHIPPLRERKEDIILLAYHFGNAMLRDLQSPDIVEFSEELLSKLIEYPWPGNIRELKNVIERAIFLSPSPLITEVEFNPWKHFSPEPIHTTPLSGSDIASTKQVATNLNAETLKSNSEDSFQAKYLELNLPLDFSHELQQLKKAMLKKALQQSKFQQSEAAKLLSLTYAQFRGYLKAFKNQLD